MTNILFMNIPSTIVCLGNPGQEYAKTRHNAGFLVGEKLLGLIKQSDEWQFEETTNKDVRLIKATGNDGRVVRLFFPLAFMNRTGETLWEYLHYRPETISINDAIVVRDELDLLLGSFKVRQSAGSGGHRGVESLQKMFGAKEELWQVKIGIGRDPRIAVDAYVLQMPKADEAKEFTQAIDKAADFLFHTIVQQDRPLEAITDKAIKHDGA